MLSACVVERSKALTTVEGSIAGMVEELAMATDKGDVDCQGRSCWDDATIPFNECFKLCEESPFMCQQGQGVPDWTQKDLPAFWHKTTVVP